MVNLSHIVKYFKTIFDDSQNFAPEERNETKPTASYPQLLVQRGIEALNTSADDYYQRMSYPNPVIAKPFSDIKEAPTLLICLGKLLEGLHLSKGMTVMDFGAGVCWLSRCIAQMQCQPIAVDVSSTALVMGQRLFQDYPPIFSVIVPKFLHLDGHRLSLENNSIDRIICFDAFHHVPNRTDIMQEFYRVLCDGGIAGFSEPFGKHSENSQSQAEMRNYGVLEDDINLSELERDAKRIGFKFSKSDQGIFFLQKGTYKLDSRSSEGLACKIERIHGRIRVTNTGSAKWLCNPPLGLGKVQIGAHSFNNGKLINYDAYRQPLERDVLSRESFEARIDLPPGEYVVDMVSEGVAWFENCGSGTLSLAI
jgi:2-polyprenyl-3-methyl-5-hydroxy-6-metoxy-1,4-benzoquinol methylase